MKIILSIVFSLLISSMVFADEEITLFDNSGESVVYIDLLFGKIVYIGLYILLLGSPGEGWGSVRGRKIFAILEMVNFLTLFKN